MKHISGLSRPRFLPDNFTLALIGTLVLASLLPCRGAALQDVDRLTNVAIAVLFFLHGAKLSREAVIAGASHWRLHALVLLTTFVLFPLFGLALKPLLSPLVTPTLYAGILFLCTRPPRSNPQSPSRPSRRVMSRRRSAAPRRRASSASSSPRWW
jgi:solute carrier family 10 (sodium/bile acid cotransporter), member 7